MCIIWRTITSHVGVPESPFNVTVLETTSSSIFLTWLEPFGNNAPIIRYIVMFNDSSNGEVGTYIVEDNMKEANITELKPFTKYAVRIFAANSVGQSSPSEQQLVITAEDGAPKCIKHAYVHNYRYV